MLRIVLSGRRGFSLLELMIVLAIVGLLAAVAIPVLSGYIRRSKASEAFTVMQAIRDKEEAYFTEFKRYTTAIPWTPYPLGSASANGICGRTQMWQNPPAEWGDLGFDPGGPTYYTYQVRTPYQGNVYDGTPPPAVFGTTWRPGNYPWFVVDGSGDIDCDGNLANFHVSSGSRDVFHVEEERAIY